MSSIKERIISEYGDGYDVTYVHFTSGKTKAVIICPDHGPFHTTPDNFIYNAGCPKCRGVHPRGYPKRRLNPRVETKQKPGPKPVAHSFHIFDLGPGKGFKIGMTHTSKDTIPSPHKIIYSKAFESYKICRSVERLIESVYSEREITGGVSQEIIKLVDSVPSSS